jgi:hypothetical protein
MEPRPLSNINYVVTEYRGQIDPFDIKLYFPYVRGTLRAIPPERRREGHLGSDFSYEDFRTWLYEEGHQYDLLAQTDLGVQVRGVCIAGADRVRHGAGPFDVYLDSSDAFVRRIEYRSPNTDTVSRVFCADDVMVIDGIAMAGRMTMTDHVRRHRTTIRLERAWHDRDINPGVFSDRYRRHTNEYLAGL